MLIILISFTFTLAGFLVLPVYTHFYTRYLILAIIIIAAVLYRKTITKSIKTILSMKKA
jgi:hypothetical protein